MKQYIDLIEKIRKYGRQKGDRTGTGTVSIFGHEMRFDMKDGFPLLGLKKTHFKSVVHELLWFLKGSTNTKYLKDNGVKIWDEWADENGELGPVYGKQWVDWGGVNQIEEVVNQLKSNPDSRRIMVNSWNVSEIDKMKLPPCHYGFQFYSDELTKDERYSIWIKDFDEDESILGKDLLPKRRLSLKWTQRSCDTFLGIPFNIASYGLLLHMVAQCVNMVPHELIGSLGDTHLYLNHSEQVDELLSRWKSVKDNESKLPLIKLNPEIKDIFSFKYEDIAIQNYNPMPSIKAPVAI